jgi:hypothetical protein
MKKLGLAALSCYAIHAGFHILNGRPEEVLWMCHLGAALVGAGLLIGSPITNGIGTLFLCIGTPLWVMYLAGGGEFYPTSTFPHVGGLAIGLYGVRRFGLPSGTWWKAVAALVALILVCRFITPARANVNVAFAIYPGWETIFPSHLIYIAVLMIQSAGYFLFCEFAARRWFVRDRASEGAL